jgi:hypothetical protein
MLAALLRDALGLDLGEGALVEAGTSFADLLPASYTADLVLSGSHADLVVEVQLARDDDKRASWPFYAASQHARSRRPTYLVVITLDRGVARWARRPIATFQGGGFVPLVIGPDEIPVVTDPEVLRSAPELAVLSAMVHGRSGGEVARAVGAAGLVAAAEVRRVDEDRGKLCFDAVLAAVGAAAGEILEAVMKAQGWEPQSEIMRNWMREAREEGRAEGMREMIAHLAGTLGIALDDERRAALSGASDAGLVALHDHLVRERRWPE